MKSWKDISPNPEDIAVIENRRSEIRSSRGRDYSTLLEFLSVSGSQLTRGLTPKANGHSVVFDVGFANHSEETESISGELTHGLIKKVFGDSKVVGIDPVAMKPCDSQCTHFTSVEEAMASMETQRGWVDSKVFCLNVIEHVDSATSLLRELRALSTLLSGGRVFLSTPNPMWAAHIYSWLNDDNLGVNVDHVALFGASELVELASRSQLRLIEWGYFGAGDMPKTFRPGPGVQRVFWALFYPLARLLKLPVSHNQIYAVFEADGQ